MENKDKLILFLDDSEARAAVAYQRMSSNDRNNTIWCRTAKEAIKTLWDYRKELDVAMLDHDLEGESFVNIKREDCGMEIVRFLENKSRKEKEEFEDLKSTVFIIHSYNTYAAPKMVDRLLKIGLKAYWKPFGL